MIPYGDFTFFFIALVILLPVIILGFMGKQSKIYNGLSTAVMIILIFSSTKHNLFGQTYLSLELINFILYLIWQVMIIIYYWHSRAKNNTTTKFISVIFLSILPLIIVKVMQSSWFGTAQLKLHESKFIEFIGFLGISYVTFKSVQLLMEIRDGSIKEVRLWKVVQFISFFPTISSGPIDRYKRFVKDDNKILSGSDYSHLLVKAIHYIMLGYLYKYIIAYLIQTFAINPLMLDFSGVITKWLYMYA
ncbi:D-alanyl-lipoteichoic acid biosynthesis protein DltB, partial [Staphylococcus cohnii]